MTHKTDTKIYLDDIRPAPEGWEAVRTIEEARCLLLLAAIFPEEGSILAISLDHDMGACAACTAAGTHIGDQSTPEQQYMNTCPHAQTGYDFVMWMIEHDLVPPLVSVHSMNPVGRQRMIAALESRARYRNIRGESFTDVREDRREEVMTIDERVETAHMKAIIDALIKAGDHLSSELWKTSPRDDKRVLSLCECWTNARDEIREAQNAYERDLEPTGRD